VDVTNTLIHPNLDEGDCMTDRDLLAVLLADKSPAEIEQLEMDVAISRLAGLLHTLLCPLNHETDCDFYVEENTTMRSEARREWFWRVQRLLQKATISPDELKVLVTRVPSIVTIVKEPCLLRFLNVLMPSLLSLTAGQAVQPAASSSSQCGLSKTAESLAE
jgi:hypothetical protein